MTAPLTDAELDEIERLVHTSCADDKAAAVACLVIVEKVPRLLAEVRRLRGERDREAHEADVLHESARNALARAEVAERDLALARERVAELERALGQLGPRVCGFNCRPEDPEHERFCSAWNHNARVAEVLAGAKEGA